MRSFSNWMITIFMVMFWGFRVVVAYMAGTNREFMLKPMDTTVEIALLFITFICIILVIKRKLAGGIIYLAGNFAYFGVNFFNAIKPIFDGGELQMANGLEMFVSLIAVILSIVVVMDLLADKTRRPEDKKTGWFYDNKDLDRNLDDRADKNNYRTM